MIDEENIRPLTTTEIEQTSGGMKWVRGVTNPDVVDARGGYYRFGIFGSIAIGISGDATYVPPPPWWL